MSESKHFERTAWVITAVMLVLTILFMNGAALGIEVMANTMGYESRLFDNTRVHTIDIVMDNWDELIENAVNEEYYPASIIIDGEAYKNVGIRGKGNTSLSNVASMGSERYSFKLEFDHYDSSKSYYGLDKLCLNNLIQDSTMMKDYLVYTMMNEFGVDSPLCSFAYITVNGEDWGLYLAVEGIEDGFLERNYGSEHGELYKPDSTSFGGGRGNGKGFDMNALADVFDGGNVKNNDFVGFGENTRDIGDFEPQEQGDRQNKNEGFGGFDKVGGKGDLGASIDETSVRAAFEKLGLDSALLDGIDFDNITFDSLRTLLSSLGEDKISALINELMGSIDFDNIDLGIFGGFGGMGSSDVKLQYIDDELDSYSNIWDNAKTKIKDSDKTRLIESLKKLSEYKDIESIIDIDEVLRYFVVHNFVCNGDSYTGSMVHNYYLYEKDGRLSMLPWDYNLAFGTFQGGNAQSTVNEPIDSPISGGNSDDRPMWGWILSDTEYTELYHRYFAEFLDTVDISEIIDNAYELIKSYVELDPTKFYSYDEFEVGVSTLKSFCELRSTSIEKQLESGETAETMNYADASGISLSDMGTMSVGGGMKGDMPGMDRGEMPEIPSLGFPNETAEIESFPSGENTNGSNAFMPSEENSARGEIGNMPQHSGTENGMNEPPSGFDPSQSGNIGGFDDAIPEGGQLPELPNEGGMGGRGNDSALGGKENRKDFGDMAFGDTQPTVMSAASSSWVWIAISAVVLAIGIVIAKLFR